MEQKLTHTKISTMTLESLVRLSAKADWNFKYLNAVKVI